MNGIAAVLERVVSDLDLSIESAVRSGGLGVLSDAEKMEFLRLAGEAQRRLDALVVETVASVDGRPAGSGVPTFAAVFGCRNMNELLQRVLRVDATGAGRVTKAAGVVHRDVELTTGARLPARWPALREAMLDGAIGVAGMLAATDPIERTRDRIGGQDRLRADAELAACARGLGSSDPETSEEPAQPAPPATPDDLRQFAQLIATYLDPDGAAPTEAQAAQNRSLTIGRLRDGVYPIRGALLPETYGQLTLILDAQNNPKVGGAPDLGVTFRDSDEDLLDGDGDPFNSDPRAVIDPRTLAQKRHDALAFALGLAARHEDMPSLGGAAPTLVVQVEAEDFVRGTGWARVAGVDAPVPVSVAAHAACSAMIQRVLFHEGRIVAISTTDRLFNAHQRRAIVLRDKECLIPGCHVPASWCEIHHVEEHSRGGPTHTDNGVPLCWWHHRTIDHSGWEIRVVRGRPQIRGPAWWDPTQEWRAPRPLLPEWIGG
ncbi:HNH endonuclease [Microbacterium sp. M28]|uniref:HNH endonuclease signature motif containing protein n=1 Tax=Microbacterium sp. M28 TaxID=2962064 RepID=UPI0021F3D5F9|nr:HNH endonuclease signature motif containing protein [Microbacterium sp. M28]UYO96231.1 HNH endonuclease [Microbacterium sp. M28]